MTSLFGIFKRELWLLYHQRVSEELHSTYSGVRVTADRDMIVSNCYILGTINDRGPFSKDLKDIYDQTKYFLISCALSLN